MVSELVRQNYSTLRILDLTTYYSYHFLYMYHISLFITSKYAIGHSYYS